MEYTLIPPDFKTKMFNKISLAPMVRMVIYILQYTHLSYRTPSHSDSSHDHTVLTMCSPKK